MGISAQTQSRAQATVICPGCHQPREVATRHSRRQTMCRRCRRPPQKFPVTDSDRLFWLRRFSDRDLAEIAVALFNCTVTSETIASRRVALTGSAAYDPPWKDSSPS